MGKLFGTDGVRGIPGRYPLDPGGVRRIALAAATVLRRRQRVPAPSQTSARTAVPNDVFGAALLNGTGSLILLGRDSRGSGAALTRQLAQGFAKAGCTTVDAGVIPTPALAYLVPRRGVLCGVVVSASHNPAEFNGIKFFTHEGFKLPPEVEREIEDALTGTPDPQGAAPKTIRDTAAAEEEYIDFLRSTFPAHLDLSGLKIVVDCANGAAFRIAPRLFQQLGAQTFSIGCRPNGSNINRGFGALESQAMRREVRRHGCDCGVSFDGDADRAIFADRAGALCDGDVLLSMAAVDMRERGLLNRNKAVLTVMSNYGLIRFLQEHGIETVIVPVGDRNVTEAIERENLSLGGEASGHIVFRRFGPTGDGLLTALQTLAVLVRTGKSLGYFRKRYRICPQVLRNVRVENRVPLEDLPGMQRCIRECERRLRGKGRVFVRYSGTEPLVRILVEGPELDAVRRMSEQIAATFNREILTHGH